MNNQKHKASHNLNLNLNLNQKNNKKNKPNYLMFNLKIKETKLIKIKNSNKP
jgi:hypothetical protein